VRAAVGATGETITQQRAWARIHRDAFVIGNSIERVAIPAGSLVWLGLREAQRFDARWGFWL